MNLKFFADFLNRFNFLKKNFLYKFSRTIIFSLIIKSISKLFSCKINHNLIIMGAHGGEAYIGNTKYLFEFLKKHSNYELVWITKSNEVINLLNKKGYYTVFKYSLNAIRLLRKAQFIFVTHGLVDILPIEFSPNTIFVSTWHGVQNKKNETEYDPIAYPKWVNLLKLKIKTNDVIDYFITTSGTKKDIELIVNHFQIPSKKIITTGYPRNDILFSNDPNLKNLLLNKFKISEKIKRIILYAPTFRDDELIAKFPLNIKELLELNIF